MKSKDLAKHLQDGCDKSNNSFCSSAKKKKKKGEEGGRDGEVLKKGKKNEL